MDMSKLEGIKLINGLGDPLGKELCVMSAVAYMAGERHGDHPKCACPVVTSLAIGLNDGPWWDDDAHRTRALLPLVEDIIGTRSTSQVTAQRAALAAHVALTEFAPHALDSATGVLRARAMTKHADALEHHAAVMRALTPGDIDASVTADKAAFAASSARDAAATACLTSYTDAEAAAATAVRAAAASVDAATATRASASAATSAYSASAADSARYAAGASIYAIVTSTDAVSIAAATSARYAAHAAADASAAARQAFIHETDGKAWLRNRLLQLLHEVIAINAGPR